MVYKKYIKRDGKVYGPYVYKSRKENGKVITEYLGTHKNYKKKNNKKKKPSVSSNALIVLGIFSILFLSFFLNLSPTGKVSLSIDDNYIEGEQITGDLELSLKHGELIPISSKLLINNSGEISEYALSNFISQEITKGDFYVDGAYIEGEGEGYGFIGEQIIYPEISFELKLVKEKKSKEKEEKKDKDSETPEEEEIEEEPEIPTNETTEEPVEEPEEDQELEESDELEDESETETEEPVEESEEEGEEDTSEEPEEVEEEPEDDEVEEPEESEEEEADEDEEGGATITGEVVKENLIQGVVSKGNNFVYDLPEGWSAEIKKKSVELNGEKISTDYLNLSFENGQAIVSTTYFENYSGFGEEFLTEDTKEFMIDLTQFELIAKQGLFKISLVYNGTEFAFFEKQISVFEIPVVNETIQEPVNGTLTELNQTSEINVTKLIEDETLLQYKAIIGRPTKWIKAIKVENDTNMSIEIHKKATNVTIKTGEEVTDALNELEEYENVIDQSKEEIVSGGITGMVSLDIKNDKGIITKFFEWLSNLGMTGNIILEEEIEGNIIENLENKVVELDKIVNVTEGTDVAVEYYTGAPTSFEEYVKHGKKITISSEDEFGYENILAYTLIDKKITMSDLKKIKLYWYVNESQNYTFPVENTKSSSEPNINAVVNNTSNKTIEKGVSVDVVENSVNQSVNQTVNETVIETNQTSNETVIDINNTSNETEITFGITGMVVVENNATNETVVANTNSSTNKTTVDSNSSINETIFVPEIIKDPVTNKTIKISVEFHAFDFNADGYVDYIEWIVPHLSEQTYEIIYITSAEHLDVNRSFISDIYEEVKAQDGNWSETINNGEYVRVTFERPLDKTKDITIHARSSNSTNTSSQIEVYTKDSNETVAIFENIAKNESTYQILLTELNGTHETFDLKINGSVEFDYIVDPTITITAGTILDFDGNTTLYHSVVKINDTRYLDIYAGLDGDGYAVVLQVDGTTVSKPGVPFEFDTSHLSFNTIIKINETRFLAVYTGTGNDGYAVVLQVDGTTVSKPGSAFEFEPSYMIHPSLARINETHYLCTHGGPGADGFANIFKVDGTTVTNVSSFEYDADAGGHNSVVKINDTRYLNTYQGNGGDGHVVLLQLDGTTISNISSLEYDTAQGTYNALVKMNDTHYVNVFDSTDHDGFAVVLTLDGTTISNGSDIEYDKYYGEFPSHVNVSNIYSLVSNIGKDYDGYVRVLELNQTTVSNVSTLEYDTDNGWYPSLVQINYTDYLNVYSGNGYNGSAVVFSISGLPSDDSCTYSSGNWDVECSDGCTITSDVDMGGNNIDISGTGTFTIDNANITNYGTLVIRGTDSSNKCDVRCLNGGCFVKG